jgi:glycosyltransferase involved in cell wall biosynthesis
MKDATLSVVMPNYNHAQYIPRALGALLEQSVRPDEILVVDDASTDDSVEVIEAIARANPLVRLVRNDRNRGFTYFATEAVEQTSGDYLFFAGADDYVLPGFVEKSMAVLAQYPHAGISCGFCSTFDGITGEVQDGALPWADHPVHLPPDELAGKIGRYCIPAHNAVIKRACYQEAGGHPPDLKWLSDWFLNLVVAFRHGLCFIPEPLALFRTLPTSYSGAGLRDRARMTEVLNCLFDLLRSPAYRDLLPRFHQSGTLGLFGAHLLVAAASRPDGWGNHVLPLINCFHATEYQAMLDDEDPRVRELACFFMRTVGPRDTQIQTLQETLHITRTDLQRAQKVISFMENTKFWKLRTFLKRSKQAVQRLAFRRERIPQ